MFLGQKVGGGVGGGFTPLPPEKTENAPDYHPFNKSVDLLSERDVTFVINQVETKQNSQKGVS